MSTNQTPNYGLNQWELSDKIQMNEFNADNAKIDAAIKAEADARTAGDAALNLALNLALDKRGNCQMWVHTYTGNGLFGQNNPVRLTFPQKPTLIILVAPHISWGGILTPDNTSFVVDIHGAAISWSGNTMSYYSNFVEEMLNASGRTYKVFAFWMK